MPRIVVIISFSILVGLVVFINLKNENLNVLQSSTTQSPVYISFPQDHGEHRNFKKEWWNISFELNATAQNTSKNFASNISFSRINHTNKDFNNFMIGVLDSNLTRDGFAPANSSGTLEVKNEGKLSINFKSNQNDITLTELPDSENLSRFTLNGKTTVFTDIDLTFRQTNNYKGPSLWGYGGRRGCSGLISIFDNKRNLDDTFMYSIPGYSVSGKVTYKGVVYSVRSGTGWLDHKWHNSEKDIENWKSQIYTKADLNDSGSNLSIGSIYNYGTRGATFYGIVKDGQGNSSCTSNGDMTTYHKEGYPRNISVNFNNRTLIFNSIRSTEKYFYYFLGDRIPYTFVNYYSNVRFYIDDFRILDGKGFIETGINYPDPNL